MPQNLNVKTVKTKQQQQKPQLDIRFFLNHILPKNTREAWFSPNIFKKKSRANCFIRVLIAISESKMLFFLNEQMFDVC